MGYQKMSTLLSQLSKPKEPSNLLTGVQLVSNVVLTTNHQLLYQVVILHVYNVLYVWLLTPLLLQKLFLVLTTHGILCTQNVLSYTGTSVKVWKKVSSLRLVRILLLLKKITKKLVLKPQKVKVMMKIWVKNIRLSSILMSLSVVQFVRYVVLLDYISHTFWCNSNGLEK